MISELCERCKKHCKWKGTINIRNCDMFEAENKTNTSTEC